MAMNLVYKVVSENGLDIFSPADAVKEEYQGEFSDELWYGVDINGMVFLADGAGGASFSALEEVQPRFGIERSDGLRIYEGDRVKVKVGEDKWALGEVAFGEYAFDCNGKVSTHIGFFVFWGTEGKHYQLETELGFWLQKGDMEVSFISYADYLEEINNGFFTICI